MREKINNLSRRRFLAGAGAIATASSFPFVPRKAFAARTLKVGTYGGYFQDSFDKHVFPDFTAATGIEVESIGEPTGEAWLVQLEQAARAGQAPADVSMMSNTTRLRGESSELWARLAADKLPNIDNVSEHFVARYDDGALYGAGAVSWYITLVTNTDVYPEAPTSWNALWDPENEDRLGLLALASNSFLLEITAATFFGGKEILGSRDGVTEVLNKLSEVRPNVKLWYRDEGQFQQALQSGEIPMGQYYHDVTGLAAADGFPVRSTFPAEGGVLDSGFWVVSRASEKLDEAQEFINYMCQPEVQATLSRRVGTAPTLPRSLLDLTAEEFAAVSSEIAPIIPSYNLYLEEGDWVAQQWTEMITG